jgi:hypothetical protein
VSPIHCTFMSEKSPNSAEQQPLNADAASAPPQGWTGFVTRCHAQNGPRYQLSLGKLSAHQSARAAQSLIRQKVRPSPPDALKRVTAPVASAATHRGERR